MQQVCIFFFHTRTIYDASERTQWPNVEQFKIIFEGTSHNVHIYYFIFAL